MVFLLKLLLIASYCLVILSRRTYSLLNAYKVNKLLLSPVQSTPKIFFPDRK